VLRVTLALAGFKRPTVAVRFCPVCFALRPLAGPTPTNANEGNAAPASLLALPRRWIFAVVAHDAVVLFDTQQPMPLALLSNYHFSALTDAAWSVCVLGVGPCGFAPDNGGV
jgi:chromatin assembly factor 1 subunit B